MSIREELLLIGMKMTFGQLDPEEMADAVMALIPTWVKVEDDLPEENGWYKIFDENKSEITAYFRDGKWTMGEYETFVYKPNHWKRITVPEGL